MANSHLTPLRISQAMILAAGRGERMRPLTLTTPKPLIPVAGTPLIVWHINKLIAAGISEIVINAGHLSQVMTAFFDNYQSVANIRLSVETTPLETAGGIKYALTQGLLRDEAFLLINGDVWSDWQIDSRLVLNSDTLAHLYLVDNPSHNSKGDFALDNGRVIPKNAAQDSLTFAGISVLSPRLFDDLTTGSIAALAPILTTAIANNQVLGDKLPAATKWVDVGTVERLAALEAYLANLKK